MTPACWPYARAAGGVEVQVLHADRHLVLGIEVEEHPVGPAAGVVGHPQPVEGDPDAGALEGGVGGNVAGVLDGQRATAGRGRGQVAEGVGGMLPRPVLERPQPTHPEGLGLGLLGSPQRVGGPRLPHLPEPGRRLGRGLPAQHRQIVEPGLGVRHAVRALAS